MILVFILQDDSVVIQEISSLFRDLVKEVEGIYRNAFNVEFRIDRLAVSIVHTFPNMFYRLLM